MVANEHTLAYALRRRFFRVTPLAGSVARAFGWLVGILIGVLVVTGIMLAFYYQPDADTAYDSVRYIMRDVGGGWSGWLCRGIHSWAAEVLIGLGMLQFLRVFLIGAYRRARRSHWRLGLVGLALLFAFAFTGDVLGWDEAAYWSAVRSLDWLEALPLIGPSAASVLRGGEAAGPTTLRNFYAFHVLLLPALAVVLGWLWSWLPRRTPRRFRKREEAAK